MYDKRRRGCYAFSLFLLIPRKSHRGVFACENRRQTFGVMLGFHDDIDRLLRFIPRHQEEKEKRRGGFVHRYVVEWEEMVVRAPNQAPSDEKISYLLRSQSDPPTTPTPTPTPRIQSRSSKLPPSPNYQSFCLQLAQLGSDPSLR